MPNEVRVDPLTGLKTIIAGGARRPARRPASTLDPPPPIDPETRPVPARPRGPDAARGLRACAPDGGAPDTPGWTRARRAEPLPGARRPDADEPDADANPDLFTAQPAARRARGDRQRARAGHLARRPRPPSRSRVAMEAWRERMRAHADAACVHLIVNERREARRLAAAHARAALRAATSSRRRSPASASASAPTRRARWAATCSATSCRRRSAGASGSSRSTTRRC